MGKLTNLNPITDKDIPVSIARDTEVTAAINAHVAATDPHTQYLRSDSAQLKIIRIENTAPAAASGSKVIPHNLPTTTIIQGVTCIIQHNPSTGGAVGPNHTYTPGYEFQIALTSTGLALYLTATNSQNLYSKPVKIIFFYSTDS